MIESCFSSCSAEVSLEYVMSFVSCCCLQQNNIIIIMTRVGHLLSIMYYKVYNIYYSKMYSGTSYNGLSK